ncbi:MAG: hypothetical protein ABI809_03715, partial [Caldimonas sp.]
PESFVFSRDGRYLYGSSYFTGVSNIFRYEVATGTVEAVSNAETGFFRPQPLADGRLAVLTYTGQGFVPAIIDAKPLQDVSAIKFLGAELAARHPVVTTWQVPPPSTVDDVALIQERGPYAPMKQLALQNAYPVLQGYKNAAGLGYRVSFEDPIRFAKVSMTAAYTPSRDLSANQRAHVDIEGQYLGWHAGLAWNHSDFYDLFGPTKRGRKGFAAKFGHDQYLIYDDPRLLTLKTDLAYYDHIDTLPAAQNVGTSFTRLITGEAGLYYTDVRRSLGAVDDEKGLLWTTVATLNRAGREDSAQLRGSLDWGVALPLPHSSLWSRTAVGTASGERSSAVANFYFGGFGNNRIDNGTVKRYREYDSMPGFALNQISGLGFAKQLIELNLPPAVFESAGIPSLHLTWLRPALFATALWTDPDSAARRQRYSNLGTQFDLRFSVLHWYEMTLSAGYAVGYQRGRRAGSEWLISLKLL